MPEYRARVDLTQ